MLNVKGKYIKESNTLVGNVTNNLDWGLDMGWGWIVFILLKGRNKKKQCPSNILASLGYLVATSPWQAQVS